MKRLLALLLAVVMVFSLAACTNEAKEEAPTGDTATESTTTDKQEATEEQVVLRIMDWNDSIKDQREEFHKEFEETHPNVKIEYTMLSMDQYKNTFTAAIDSDESPDLFMIPDGLDMSMAIDQGWVQPFNDYLDDGFTDLFMDGTIVEGINMIDGNIYTINNQVALPNTCIYYNRELFEKAGLDPDNPPKTYSELREAAKVITEAGNGDFYGIIEGGTQINRWTIAAKDFASLGGYAYSNNAPVNMLTGTADYNSDVMVETFELFQGMAEDGSYHPSTMSISAPEARALFADGQAAMILQGVWCIGIWHNDAPDLQIGVAPQVYPDSTGKAGAVSANRAGNWLYLNANCEHPEVAAEYFQAYFSDDYCMQRLTLEAGAQFAPVKDLNEKYITDEDLLEYFNAAMVHGVGYPIPKADNPDVATVLAKYVDVSPSLGDLLQGTVAGAIPDIQSALTTLSEKTDEALSKAIDEAVSDGADVSVDDFTYADWNPLAK